MDKLPQSKLNFTALFYAVLVIGLAGAVFTFLHRHYLYDSGALYVGLPLLLAVGMSLTPKTSSAMGATMKGITVALLLSAIVLQEGTICILFAAPIFYGIGALVAAFVDHGRKKDKGDTNVLSISAVVILALMSTEGTTALTSFNRDNEITVSKIVNANQNAVLAQLTKATSLGMEKPLFLSLFPYPVALTPLGLNQGDETKISFVYFKHIWWTKVTGDLVLKTIESTPNKINFQMVSDDSYLSHYLKWQSSEVSFASIDETHTKVTWRLSYKRILDPAWYFGPMQNYAVRLAAEELIDHVATPDGL
jgi:hypothetical protein